MVGGESREGVRASPKRWLEPSHAVKHLEIIEQFGRFPHRNAILGRDSTPEELRFLEEGGEDVQFGTQRNRVVAAG